MKYDKFGQAYTDQQELCDLLYKNPDLDITRFPVTDWERFNLSVNQLHAEMPLLQAYLHFKEGYTIEEFDRDNQNHWHMPDEYQTLDIARWVLEQCQTDAELQRVGEELLLYQERNLFPLLQFLKYLVDTMRANNVVWGVGRGSSVASYVLFLLGVHKINSMYYDLDIAEFLK